MKNRIPQGGVEIKRRMVFTVTAALAFCLTVAASREAAAEVFIDNFDTSHTYWDGATVDVSGTIWSGMQGTAFAEYANANDTNATELTIRKNSTSNAGSSSPFDSAALYIDVTGDFDAQVEMPGVSSLDVIPFRTHSLAAWTADQTKAIHLDNILGTTNTRRFRDFVGGDDFADTGGGVSGWFRLERIGDSFSGYWATDGCNWTLLATIDTSGDPYGATLRVGVATWNDSGSDFGARFDNFALMTPTEIAITNVVVADTAGISFDSDESLTYRLEATPDLVSSNYSDTGAFVTGSGGPMTLFDPTGTSTSKNYRVVVEL
jgi:hypothetical protein